MEAVSQISEATVIQEVRMRFRICNYLFNAAGIWIASG
jgi:hypothetical protein